MITIRQATSDDADQISELIGSLSHFFFAAPDGSGGENFVEATTPAALSIFIARPDIHYLIGEWDGDFCGAAAIRARRHLNHLFVAPAYQGRGIGGQLWLAAPRRRSGSGKPGRVHRQRKPERGGGLPALRLRDGWRAAASQRTDLPADEACLCCRSALSQAAMKKRADRRVFREGGKAYFAATTRTISRHLFE